MDKDRKKGSRKRYIIQCPVCLQISICVNGDDGHSKIIWGWDRPNDLHESYIAIYGCKTVRCPDHRIEPGQF